MLEYNVSKMIKTYDENEYPYDANEYSDLESRSEALGWDLFELLDHDEEFHKDILYFIFKTGTDFDQICYGGVALAQYFLERIIGENYSIKDFINYWIESVEYHDLMVKAVDSALERAREKIEAMELKSNLESNNEGSLC